MGTVRAQTSTLKKRRYAFRRVRLMSALGHKQTFRDVQGMSALPPKADIRG